MSHPDDPKNPISEFHKDLQSVEAKPISAGRSAADEIIEVIGDLGPKKKRSTGCPACESGRVTTTRPLGGAPRNTCGDCSHRWYGVSRGPAPLVLSKLGSPQTQTSGPYYKRGPALPPSKDRHAPKSRTKARSLAHLKKLTDGD